MIVNGKIFNLSDAELVFSEDKGYHYCGYRLYRIKGKLRYRWLIVHRDFQKFSTRIIPKYEAKSILAKEDLDTYIKIFKPRKY